MTADALAAIRASLDRVAAAGRRLLFWWRDDDAVRDGPDLDRLFALARATRMPVALAVIPAAIEPSLAPRVADEPWARVLVHGWRHANHQPAGEKAAEFGPSRTAREVDAELRLAREAVRSAFGERALDVFVPPWNRIAPAAAGQLAAAGYRGLSTFGSRPGIDPAGIVRVDTQIDPIAWRGGRGLVPPELIAAAFERDIARWLEDGSGSAVGLLTHHLVMDEALWSACAALLETILSHPCVYRAELDRLWRIGDLTSPANSAMIGTSRARTPR